MKVLLLTFFLAFAAAKERMKRFSIFSMVQFPNSQCVLGMSTINNVMMGTCYTGSECSANGGRASGNCASGFGVCCFFSASTCGTAIPRNCTYIQNPGSPSAYTTTGTCSYNFQATSDICQIRLDLDNTVLVNPVALTSICATDQLRVTATNGQTATFPITPPVLCGVLSGTHMYLETARTANPGSIAFTLGAVAGATNTPRTWKIKVTYIECGNPNIAPTDCLQYFTGNAGSFQSFNFQNGAGQMPQALSYVMCFRQNEGFCTLSLSQDASIATGFSLENVNNIALRTCMTAALLIPTTTTVTGVAQDQQETYCGLYLNPTQGNTVPGTVIANVAPWRIGVYNINTPGTPSIGFKIFYQQVPC